MEGLVAHHDLTFSISFYGTWPGHRSALSASCWTPRSLPWRPTALWPAGGRGDEPDRLALTRPALRPGPRVPGLARLTGQRLSASLLLSAQSAAASWPGWADAGCRAGGRD